jgi:hypothetical protein
MDSSTISLVVAGVSGFLLGGDVGRRLNFRDLVKTGSDGKNRLVTGTINSEAGVYTPAGGYRVIACEYKSFKSSADMVESSIGDSPFKTKKSWVPYEKINRNVSGVTVNDKSFSVNQTTQLFYHYGTVNKHNDSFIYGQKEIRHESNGSIFYKSSKHVETPVAKKMGKTDDVIQSIRKDYGINNWWTVMLASIFTGATFYHFKKINNRKN